MINKSSNIFLNLDKNNKYGHQYNAGYDRYNVELIIYLKNNNLWKLYKKEVINIYTKNNEKKQIYISIIISLLAVILIALGFIHISLLFWFSLIIQTGIYFDKKLEVHLKSEVVYKEYTILFNEFFKKLDLENKL